ncbi:hypothetical protein [Algihabitans albus]|uniref:hypothetical protein n=1 Tax=Algihabitans albus TaxID=2164067 RepID=UPI000E5CC110|nr:hypothetical protein [Algihabitans albus]
MFGLFGLFGKSKQLTALEVELREAGLHPQLLQDSIKLTVLRLLPEGGKAARPDELRGAAQLLAYCILGPQDFAEATSLREKDVVERRLDAVLDHPDSLDSQIVLLALTTDNADPAVAERFEAEG